MEKKANEQKQGFVYVLCPANYVTGGPDALHQMVFYLNRIGVDAKIVYVTDSAKTEISIPTPYTIYVYSFLREKDIVDVRENCVVVPEVLVDKIKGFKNVKIFLWWLSINNNLKYGLGRKIFYFMTLPLRIIKNRRYYRNNTLKSIKSTLKHRSYSFKSELPNITHLCASYYAFDYVSCRSKNQVIKCIEPISKLFLNIYSREEKNISRLNRRNIILYNPARKYNHILDKISSIAPELKFEPLRGLSQEQLIEKYKTSKLYIDFGAFPGAERIPKEAALFGCAVITGKRGASAYHGDVPIPEDYKFDNPVFQIDEVVKKIKLVLGNYEKFYSDFDEYRETVLKLEERFVKSLKEIFIDVNSVIC